MEGDAADHLHVEVTHAGDAARTFANRRKRLGQDLDAVSPARPCGVLLCRQCPRVLGDHLLEIWASEPEVRRPRAFRALVPTRLSVAMIGLTFFKKMSLLDPKIFFN